MKAMHTAYIVINIDIRGTNKKNFGKPTVSIDFVDILPKPPVHTGACSFNSNRQAIKYNAMIENDS